ncbi:hypothetical protein BASA81_004041 [Batrachochytrium salamandrivorans]|nr:hypothetical protein BASA81_004041 [Batrachochytrium salamandrivorans]
MNEEELGLRSIQRSWVLYFPFDDFSPTSPWVDATRLFRRFFLQDEKGRLLLRNVELNRASEVVFDYVEFVASLSPELSAFEEVMKASAEIMISCLGLALCSLRTIQEEEERGGGRARSRPIAPRFVNFRPFTLLTRLKADLIGKFVSVRGNVVKVQGVKPLVKRMDFECAKCGLPEGRYSPPTQCESKCKSKQFLPQTQTARTVNFQQIKLQEIVQDEDDRDASSAAAASAHESKVWEGRVPRTVTVELTDELVDCCVPGDIMVISGLVKALSPDARMKKSDRDAGLLLLLIEANGMENGGKGSTVRSSKKQSTTTSSETGDDDIVKTLTRTDFMQIRAVAALERQSFSFLVYSFCPTIFGCADVKAGLLLGLTGGCSPENAAERCVSVRNDTHVLIVGDPGMGKSQLLRFASTVSPRGVYVSGNTSSATGLTVTMVKDTGGEFSLEAGALVLGDRGVCCIDEFDKMPMQHNSLLEAMEQQSLSIAKAGVICTLCARTSVFAAANPKGGTYKRHKTLLENLNLPAPLLSRFDIVFLMLDQGDARKDQVLARHIIGMHTKTLTSVVESQVLSSASAVGGLSEQTFKQRVDDEVAEHLARNREPLQPSMLRKYLAYCKHYIPQVKLAPEACKRLQVFYLSLRQRGKQTNAIPITTRQMESLIRLIQARARIELRTIATEQDALDVISLMEEGLLDALTDSSGRVDISKSSGMSQSKLQKHFIEHLKKAVHRRLNAFFRVDQLEQEAKSLGIYSQITDFGEFLERLSDHCFLLKKPHGFQVSKNVHGMSQATGS